MNPYLKILRPKDWLKNLLVFIPALLFGGLIGNLAVLLVAFVALCLISSVTYLSNDIIDIDEDIKNNKDKPLAKGLVKEEHISTMIVALWVIAICITTFNAQLMFLIFTMFFIDMGYISKLRNIPIVDVTTIAIKYPLRVLAGFIIIGTFNWALMLAIYLLALCMALMKRKGEYLSGMKRKVFSWYDKETLDILFSAICTCLVFATIIFIMSYMYSYLITVFAVIGVLLVAKYYIDIKDFSKGKSLAILHDRELLFIGLMVLILSLLQVNGVVTIV